MKCPICSAKISDTDAFCPNCGSAVKSETSGYMDSIDTSNLGENVGFGKRNTTGAQPVNAVPQQNYAQGQQSYGQQQNGYAQQSYPPPQNGNLLRHGSPGDDSLGVCQPRGTQEEGQERRLRRIPRRESPFRGEEKMRGGAPVHRRGHGFTTRNTSVRHSLGFGARQAICELPSEA